MRKAVLKMGWSWMLLPPPQKAPMLLSKQCCVFITDEYGNVSSLLNHTRIHVNALSGLTPSVGHLLNQWFRSWWEKALLILGIIILICVFSYMYMYSSYRVCLHGSKMATKQAISMLMRTLADNLGHFLKREPVRSGECWRRSLRRHVPWAGPKWLEASTPSPVLGLCVLPAIPAVETGVKDTCWDHLDCICDWTQLSLRINF